ncbi:MAG: phosphoribosyl-ATP diphosphatase [Methanoregulaceae archaeon]|nr:phosphoribosyl-ATP diphosphatase [Methanoregulaceae archaeon]
MNDLSVLAELWEVISQRINSKASSSYVSGLVSGPKGVDRVLEKVGEEATEFIIAVKNRDRNQIVSEAADLQFHLLVALKASDVDFDEVLAELKKRRR